MTEPTSAVVFTAWIDAFADSVADGEAMLTELDAAIGDADHGGNMVRGLAAAREAVGALDPSASAGERAKAVGMALVGKVGGASGPLYGTFFIRMAAAIGDADGSVAAWATALRAGLEGIQARGKAEPGDKTMIDALVPAIDAFEAAGDDLAAATAAAAAGAARGRDATTELVARKGRASYLGERSAGHTDPGAASTALMFESLAVAAGGS
jgi:phosphoenolpyruvate---glycerone phosphotransferase subunit DhaL